MMENTFNRISCCKCGIPFGVPREFERTRRWDGFRFFCPNGHEQSYSVHDAHQVELKRVTVDRDWWKDQLGSVQEERRRLGRVIVSLRGVITRMRRRQ